MTSQMLLKAREYEAKEEGNILSRPKVHLSPRAGWMNDPNGFSYYGGKYHLFYQYYPYADHWDSMHWGHAVSTDLISWEYLPAALAPDSPADKDGCFSGSAIELEDGRQLLLYTGVDEHKNENGDNYCLQTQCVAIGDGLDYVKYENNPVMDNSILPEGASKYDFRDPKIWKEKDGTYKCIVANCDMEHDGYIVLFSSTDAINWKYESVIARNNKRYGRMWECPDFFELDGRHVLLVSPQDMENVGLEYKSGNGTVCFIGHYDEAKKEFVEEADQCVDYGIDYYAMQTTETTDGRRVMIGWMQNWDTCNTHAPEEKWQGQMALPREISVINGRLYQRPVKELESYRENKVEYTAVEIGTDKKALDGVNGRTVDMEISLDCSECREFKMYLADGNGRYTTFSYDTYKSVAELDRSYSGSRRAIRHSSKCQVENRDGKINLRVVVDKYSVEVFINDGAQVMTATVFTELGADGIYFEADGKAIMNVTKYDIR